MGARVRKDPASVYANVGVHDEVAITLALQDGDAEGAQIHFGCTGPELILDFADVESLERLAAVAADGARQLRERLTALYAGGATSAGEVGRLVGAGVAS